MTKEELKKEAEEWLSKKWTPYDFYDTECNVYNDDIKEDLIKGYIAGAEPREKRIAELERKLEQTEKDLTDYQFNYPKIKDLEKENAELKKFKQDCETSICRADCQYNYEQLTKAKELLAKWVELYKPKLEGFPKPPIQVDTEQFLSEVEK